MTEPAPQERAVVHVRFAATALPDAVIVARFADLGLVAIAELNPEAPPDPPDPSGAARDGIAVWYLPAGTGSSPEQRRDAEAWVAAEAAAGAVEIGLMSDRVLWAPGRAVVIGAVRDFDTCLAGLASFACYDGELRRLEAAIAARWPTADADISLLRRVRHRDLGRWAGVGEATEEIARARLRYLIVEGGLENAPPSLAGLARRLFLELALRVETDRRLEQVSDKIEALYELYETANNRLSEYAYFQREYVLEMLIILALAIEVTLWIYLKQ